MFQKQEDVVRTRLVAISTTLFDARWKGWKHLQRLLQFENVHPAPAQRRGPTAEKAVC